MNINTLHVIEGLDKSLGGLPYALANILQMERELGISSTVVSINENSKNIDINSFPDCEIITFPSSFPSRFKNSSTAVNWTKKNLNAYNLVVLHSTWTILNVRIAREARKLGKPYIIWSHGSLDPFDLKKKSFLKSLLGPIFIKPLLDYSYCICCTSDREIKEIVTYGAFPKFIELPLPIKVLEKCSSDFVDEFKIKFNIDSDKIKFLFLSRLNYKKGIESIIEAVYRLPKDVKSKILILMAGTGEKAYVDSILKMINDYEISDLFKFTNHLIDNEKSAIFQISDGFLLPSMNENFGIVVVEALNEELPVIITKDVYIWDKIIGAGAGWLVENTYQSILQKIIEIIESKEYLEKRSHALKAGEQFSLGKLKPGYKTFYEKFIV